MRCGSRRRARRSCQRLAVQPSSGVVQPHAETGRGRSRDRRRRPRAEVQGGRRGHRRPEDVEADPPGLESDRGRLPVAVIILLAASVLLIANTIRLSIFSRRREIEVMKLVGATNWFVRGPFMLEGLLCGVIGATAAVVAAAAREDLRPPRHPRRRLSQQRRAGAELLAGGADPSGRRARRRRARLRHDAAPVPEGLARRHTTLGRGRRVRRVGL